MRERTAATTRLVIVFKKPYWRVMRDNVAIASLRRLTSAKARAREVALSMVKAGQPVAITCFSKDGAHHDESIVRAPSERARPLISVPEMEP